MTALPGLVVPAASTLGGKKNRCRLPVPPAHPLLHPTIWRARGRGGWGRWAEGLGGGGGEGGDPLAWLQLQKLTNGSLSLVCTRTSKKRVGGGRYACVSMCGCVRCVFVYCVCVCVSV